MPKFYPILAKKATGILVFAVLSAVLANPAMARVPNDPNYADQEKMWNQIGAPAAWDVSVGSPVVVVAVIDTGADTWHGDLDSNVWTNPYEIPDNSVDDDHNGYVDDIHGWNFVENNNDVRTSVFDNNDDPEAVRHGTIISGLIGAEGDNGTNGVGINWRVKIIPLRAIESSGSGLLSTVARAVDYAVKNGAAVISMSFVGDSGDPSLKESLRRAYEKGVVIVTAAGNHTPGNGGGDLDKEPTYPACFDKDDSENWILTVGAVDQNDRLSRFSNFGSCVDMVAPGEGIFSTERYAPQFGYTKEFGGPWKGTSFAAPLVAGAAALLKSIHPEWGPDQIIPSLLITADPVETSNPTLIGKMGRGRLNIGKAMALSPSITSGESVYYFKGNQVSGLNLETGASAMVAKVQEARIVSLAVRGVRGGQTITLLIKRGDFYYIRLLRENGEFLNEFPLDISVKTKIILKRVEPLGDGSSRFIVELFDPKTKFTTFREFDTQGKKVKDFVVKASVIGWAASRTSDKLVIATGDKKKISLQEFAWDGNEKYAWTLPGVTLDDLKLANVWGKGEQVVVLVHQGKEVRQMVIDLPSRSSRNEAVTADKASWKLVLVSSSGNDTMNILPRSLAGGLFTIVTGKGKEVRQVELPKFDGFFN
ncbi:MAG: hypothetical protein A2754_02495 [Candidatus Magasanikbacteria bacterium RIFCSPHIGHO2_01_FULL_47_8]|uniref:Peptidase S8/S53 domain-containing protein n=1 Tax=Candidatus Magasanikbacteria bacterium RIFCSPHIGHO2_01_FULL_47_8 TaxID=1798673 RepID=A0A1F6MBW7_9BACT|nr:MAG: hypothetical protein A2754_02495 [Candidatus Magasanikbacteria bacterium RIFCSPHIGHO2_01_FULL_47_8]